MCTWTIGRMAFIFSLLLIAPFSISAAPAPVPAAAAIDKYLLDDTDFLLVIEVKPLLASPLAAKRYRKPIEELLQSEPVQVWLKDAGFDPLRDVERIIVMASRRRHASEKDPEGAGQVTLLQGRWDATKLRVKLAQLAKDSPQGVKVDSQGEIYRLTIPHAPSPLYFTQLDRNTLMLAGKKDLVAEAREKAAGKMKTALKSAAIREFLQQRQPDQSLQIVVDGSGVWQTAMSTTVQNGVRVVRSIEHTTLEDVGILRLRGGLRIAEKINGSLMLKTKDINTAKQTAELFRLGLKKIGEAFEAKVKSIAQNRGENLERAKKRDLAPLRKAVGDTNIEADGAAINLTTEIDEAAIATFLRIFFGMGAER